MKYAKNNWDYINPLLENKMDGIVGSDYTDQYIQDLTSCIGGKIYRDKLTNQAFTPANLADGIIRTGTWSTANSDWMLFNLKRVFADDFTKGVFSTGASGYQKLPSGLILQWNSGLIIAVGGGSSLRVNFPLAFTNACWYVDGVWGSDYQFVVTGIDKTGFSAVNNDGTTRVLNSYFCIGY